MPQASPDQPDLVAYLDASHYLIDVMEFGRDVITPPTPTTSSAPA
ncbi:hypothetical protein PUR57_35190 [Streptomyces sp. JV176]|nr:hypothetical protein [Streptomyces sp. JV176]MEE1803856.1 hypothetical protein [Streptomyces sp. JV176]